MKTPTGRFLTFALIILCAAALQLAPRAIVLGVRPDLVLAVTISIGFFVAEPLSFALLVLVAGVLLRFTPGVDFAVVVLTALILVSYWLKGRIVWPGLMTDIFLIFFSTLLFYLCTAPGVLYHHPFVAVFEACLNVFFGVLLYEVLLLKYGETRSAI